MRQIFHRVASAAIMAGGVTLLAAGLLSYTAPPAIGDPLWTPAGSGAPVGAGPLATDGSDASSPTPSPRATESRRPSPSPGRSGPGASPRESPTPVATPVAVASRVVVPSLDIDLPVVPGDHTYPLCDVAQWLLQYGQPGQGRTVYLYGHAREGMFLPLLRESERQNGRGMLGALV